MQDAMLEELVEEAQVTVDSWLTNADDLCPRTTSSRTPVGRIWTEYDGMVGDECW